MANTKRDQYKATRQKLREDAQDADKPWITPAEADLIDELCDAFDKKKLEKEDQKRRLREFDPKSRSNRSSATLKAWTICMKMVAKGLGPDCSLAEATIDDLIAVFEDSLGEMSIHTLQQRQRTCRVFYRYHYDLAVSDADLIATYDLEADGGTDDDRGFDPEDMLDRDEINAMKEACQTSRDRAIFMTLLYTGMRNTALRNLKWKHLFLDEGEYRFPALKDGTKGIHEPERRRPLLYAAPALKQWRQDHPDSDDPDAYVITANPNDYRYDPYDTVSEATIRKRLRKIAANTGLQSLAPDRDAAKPTHPHMMRHNFVTLCKEEYGLHDSTVKFYIGHKPESKVMETTYSHLSDNHHIDEGKEKFGLKEPDEGDNTLTPDECMSCGQMLAPGAKACDRCGTLITPDAKAARDLADDAVMESAMESDPDADEEQDSLKKLQQFLTENPEVAAENPEIIRDMLS